MLEEYAGLCEDRQRWYRHGLLAMAWFCIVLGLIGDARGEVYPVAARGYYDEPSQPNAVDFEAAGSTLHYNEVTQVVNVAYCNGQAGVYQCESLRFCCHVALDYAPDNLGFHTKVILLEIEQQGIGGTASGHTFDSISGPGLCVHTPGGDLTFEFGQIFYGPAGEQLVGLGLTLLSARGTNYGRVVAIAHFTDGTTASASREINEDRGLGDTFFGFRAPAGAAITRLHISSETGIRMGYDDLVFFTSIADGTPKLKIRRLPPEQLELSWAAGCSRYVLQSSSLISGAEWIAVTNTVGVARDRFILTLPSTNLTKAFRLQLSGQ
jgi:hypothetical protein